MITATGPTSSQSQAIGAKQAQVEESVSSEATKSQQHAQEVTQAYEHHATLYPVWPTSQPGPPTTLPPPGQHPHPRRTDQMVYECYDQESGISCIPSL